MTTLAIVLGAGGRVGQDLLRKLIAQPVMTVAVTRTVKPSRTSSSIQWIQIDLTDPSQRACRRFVLQRLASGHRKVALLDLVLDRQSVRAMRRSIAASTTFVLDLGRYLHRRGHEVRYILASTTAILASRVFQTPYGLAKKRQLAAYLGEATPTAAALLPALALTSDSASDHLIWSYERAAHLLAQHVESSVGHSRLFVPIETSVHVETPSVRQRVIVQLASLTWQRDDPLVQRRASHARLLLVPTRWRHQLDHHGAPEVLVARAARRYNVAVERVSA